MIILAITPIYPPTNLLYSVLRLELSWHHHHASSSSSSRGRQAYRVTLHYGTSPHHHHRIAALPHRFIWSSPYTCAALPYPTQKMRRTLPYLFHPWKLYICTRFSPMN